MSSPSMAAAGPCGANLPGSRGLKNLPGPPEAPGGWETGRVSGDMNAPEPVAQEVVGGPLEGVPSGVQASEGLKDPEQPQKETQSAPLDETQVMSPTHPNSPPTPVAGVGGG